MTFSKTVFICLIMLCFLWLYILWKRRKYYLLAFKIKGPLGYPLIGMANKLMRRADILSNLSEYEKIYGNFFYSWLGPMPVLIVLEPQIAQDILTSPHCINKGFMYDAITDGTGDGLFSLKEPEWSSQRKLINPLFNHKVLSSYMPIFNEESQKLTNILAAHDGKDEFDITKIIQSFTLAIALKTTMGHDLGSESELSKDLNLLESYQCIQQSMAAMIFSPWLKFNLVRLILGIYKPYKNAKYQIRQFIRDLIAQKMVKETSEQEEITNKTDSPNIFINAAIELFKKGDFNYKNIEDQSNIVVFGAFETTANTIAYTLMLLAMFPVYQQKLFNEIKSIFPNKGDFNVTIANMHELVYMDMVINETMRLLAPVPLIARHSTASLKLSNGITLPAGIQIAIDIFHMQRREDIWGPEAQKFNPEHFLPSNLVEKHPYAFIPFTKGMRTCIGWRYASLSIKVALTKLLRNYRFGTTFNFDDLHFVEDITLKLSKVPLLTVTPRYD